MSVSLKATPGRQYESYGVDESGNYLGKYYQCCCCLDWVSNWEKDTYAGDDERSRHYCIQCLRDQRTPQIDVKAPSVVPLVPPMYLDASLSDIKGLVAKKEKILYGWPKDIKQLALIGNPGSGKSRACFAFVKLLARRGVKATYRVAMEAKADWAAAFKRNDIARVWLNTPYLIFDDISGCGGSDGWAECLHMLLDVRTKEQRPTIITTASDFESLQAIYGDAIGSRLFLFESVELPRKDWRKK